MNLMTDEHQPEHPYQTLGTRLKRLRERVKETLAEVSGAVEVEIDTLKGFESGQCRPTEDILLLLISHFGMKDSEATKLWALAGYDPKASEKSSDSETSVLVLPTEARISYTDMVHVTANSYGVVINFLQTAGPQDQPLLVSRLGMSREHAQSVLEILIKTLQSTEPKALPAPAKPLSKKQKKTDR